MLEKQKTRNIHEKLKFIIEIETNFVIFVVFENYDI
jgi:hypothetical protein